MQKLSNFNIPPPTDGFLFEDLCRDLFKAEYPEAHIAPNGRPGQGQQGVDLYINRGQNGYLGIQCKCRSENTDRARLAAELKLELEKARDFKPPLARYLIATTLKRDATLQELERVCEQEEQSRAGGFEVRFLFWNDILEMLDTHPTVYQRYYLGAYAAESPAGCGARVKKSMWKLPLKARPSVLVIGVLFLFALAFHWTRQLVDILDVCARDIEEEPIEGLRFFYQRSESPPTSKLGITSIDLPFGHSVGEQIRINLSRGSMQPFEWRLLNNEIVIPRQGRCCPVKLFSRAQLIKMATDVSASTANGNARLSEDFKTAMALLSRSPAGVDQALVAYHRGDFETAINLLEIEVDDFQWNDSDDFFLLGAARFQASKYYAAAEAFYSALEIRPETRTISQLGQALICAGRGQEASDIVAKFEPMIKSDLAEDDYLMAQISNLEESLRSGGQIERAERLSDLQRIASDAGWKEAVLTSRQPDNASELSSYLVSWMMAIIWLSAIGLAVWIYSELKTRFQVLTCNEGDLALVGSLLIKVKSLQLSSERWHDRVRASKGERLLVARIDVMRRAYRWGDMWHFDDRASVSTMLGGIVFRAIDENGCEYLPAVQIPEIGQPGIQDMKLELVYLVDSSVKSPRLLISAGWSRKVLV